MKFAALVSLVLALAGCGAVPSRGGAEDLLRSNLADAELFSYAKTEGGPQAKFALDRVSGISNPDPNTVRVEFIFHWTPETDAARQRVASGDPRAGECRMYLLETYWATKQWCIPLSETARGTAVFEKYDDGWRLKRVLT